jgi:hypothetical protein
MPRVASRSRARDIEERRVIGWMNACPGCSRPRRDLSLVLASANVESLPRSMRESSDIKISRACGVSWGSIAGASSLNSCLALAQRPHHPEKPLPSARNHEEGRRKECSDGGLRSVEVGLRPGLHRCRSSFRMALGRTSHRTYQVSLHRGIVESNERWEKQSRSMAFVVNGVRTSVRHAADGNRRGLPCTGRE